ncbi:hypothetical protein C8R45DRAFT_1109483 [Mycena sanguinolenta]|nr:hypothetical protein C8R45DRAFT_1109483 [Mycena sanguinolenta]
MSRRIHLKSMSTPLLLSDLPADIVFSIFACCDIVSVVSVAQTCRCLHALAFEKSVWLVLLDDLRRRCILDRNCTPNLETLSAAEMIGAVKRLMTGPQTWSPGELHYDSVAEISRTITLHPRTSDWNMAKLLTSGRYVLYSNGDKLQCWFVADDSLVWTYTSTIKNVEVLEFAAEEADTDITIMACHLDSDLSPNCIEIVRLDLQTMTHTSLLIALVPRHITTFSFYDSLICGALAAVSLNGGTAENWCMILNWKLKSYFILQSAEQEIDSKELHVALIPDHILLTEEDQLHLISSHALVSHGSPTIDIDDAAEFFPVLVEDIPKLRTFEASDAEQSLTRICVHESPIRDGDYCVWIYGGSYVADRGALLSYRVSMSTSGEPQWYLRIPSAVEPDQVREKFSLDVTYCGHRPYIVAGGTKHIMFSAALPVTSPRTVLVKLPRDAGLDLNIDIAPYSGALTYFTSSSIVVQYYG